jgi:hypothetical protein
MYFPLSSALCTVSMKWLWRWSGNMARRPSPRITTFFVKNSQGFLSFFFSFSFLFFSLFVDTVFLFVSSVYIGTIKWFALISTCKLACDAGESKRRPTFVRIRKPHSALRPSPQTAICLGLSSLIPHQSDNQNGKLHAYSVRWNILTSRVLYFKSSRTWGVLAGK